MNRRKCKLCNVIVTFAKDDRGTTQVLDTLAPVYRVTDTGKAVRVRETYVSHYCSCPGVICKGKK